MTDTTRINFAKLTNGNYSTWCYKMEMLLVKEDLWDVVVDEIPDPPDSAWKKKDGKARASIGLSVDDNQLIHIKRHSSAKQTWDALKAYHQKSTLSNKVCLLRKLCKLSLSESGDLEAHLIVMDEIMDQLTTLGEPLKDELSVAFYLSSLPESYGSLIVALETRPEADLTRDLIRGKLLDESRRRKDLAGDKMTGEENALQVSKQYGKPKSSCYFCKKSGHIKSECRKYKAWLEKNNNKANTVAVPSEREAEYVSLNVDTSNQNSEFCIDSGASIHLCNDIKYFTFLKKSEGCTVMLADGKRLEAQGIGNIRFRTNDGNKGETEIQLSDVLFVPELKSGLISVSRLVKKGCEVNFKNGMCEIRKDGRILFAVKSENDIYRVNVNYTDHESHKAFSVSLSGHVKCIHEWHRVLGHRNLSDIRKMQSLAADMRIRECEHQDVCEICAQSKSTRDPFPKVARKISKEPLDLIHTDLCGPLEVPTPRGNRYILTLIDDCSRYAHICLLKHKDETEQQIKEFVACMKTQRGKIPKMFRSDRGGEYMVGALKNFFREEGIRTQLTVPKTPQHNGVAERKNRTVIEMVRCMLNGSGLPKHYWGEAVSTACHILNRLPIKNQMVTPYEIWHERKPELYYFHEFGATVFAHIAKDQRRKLDKTSEKLIFVGYEPGTKGYRLLEVDTHKIKIRRDCKFLEEAKAGGESIEIQFEERDVSSGLNEMNIDNYNNGDDMEHGDEEHLENIQEPEEHAVRRRSPRDNFGMPPVRYPNPENVQNVTAETVSADPLTYEQALDSPDAENWILAMDEEINALRNFGTWEVTKLPPNCKVIGSKWVYKTKTDELGRPVKFKARLVAQGFSQKYGQHYDEVFAPVADPTTLKILLAVAGMNGMSVRHYDVETAFLNADLNHEVYIKQPKGYATADKNAVCRLIKNLYGLKQGAKEWNAKFDTTMKSNGYTQSDNDLCLYMKKIGDRYIYISNHVDDTVATATDDALLDQFEKEMNQHFKMKNLGDLKYYLGIQFERDDDGIFGMYQQKYIDNKLHEFNLADAKDSKVPMNAGYLKQNTEEEPFDDNEIYRRAIGSLLYLSTNTRPDIAVSTSILARRVSNPRQSDWNEVKRVFRYLKATKNLKLKLGNKDEKPNNKLICYVDADLAGDVKDRKSNSGYFFKYRGATIGWASRKQTLVAHSTAEAEFVAISEAAKEAVWIERILNDFGQTVVNPIEMMEDNQSCIRMLSDKKGSRKTRHIDIKYKFIQDLICKKKMTAIYIGTDDQIADILTKPLEGKKFAQFTEDMGLVI